MRIIRKELAELTTAAIEEIVSLLEANFSTIYHEPDMNSIVSEVFNTTFSYELAYSDKGKLLGLCPLHSVTKKRLKMTYSNPAMYEIPYGGWILDDSAVPIEVLMERMKLSINESLTYWSIPQTLVDDYSKVSSKQQFQTGIIDLALDEESIWNNVIGSKRRNMIRKALKNGVSVEILGKEYFDDYYQMMVESCQHTSVEIKPKMYYCRILEVYAPNGKAVILMAKIRAKAISGAILLRNKYMCHYWLGANRKGKWNLGQGELLQWEAIKWAKKSGSSYYDLCVIDNERLPQIARFKLGFAAEIVPFYLCRKRPLIHRVISKIVG